MYKFFAFLSRMKYIKRWALMNSALEENVMEHSQQVAVISHALAAIKNTYFNGNIDVKKVVLTAQYHECSEVITGDLPTPIKYFNPEINSAYKALETGASKKLLSMLPDGLKGEFEEYILPDTDSYEYKLVKAADRIAAYLKCVEELKSGNKEFIKAKTIIEKDIRGKNMEEADYFMDNFAAAFNLTLDELD